MKRSVISLLLAATLVVGSSGSALGISATITPGSQSHAHGVSSSWTLNWGGASPFSVYFWYDANEQYPDWYRVGTYTTSGSTSHAFWPCQGTTFRQELDVYDQIGAAYTASHATEGGGNPC